MKPDDRGFEGGAMDWYPLSYCMVSVPVRLTDALVFYSCLVDSLQNLWLMAE